jgi:hypothetical protein
MRLVRYPMRRRRGQRGQALVEFSLVILIFMTVVLAIAEFAFYLTIKIGVTDSAQDAVQAAAEVGATPDADFTVLQVIERDMGAPTNKSQISSVEIIWTNEYGNVNNGENKYTRTGTLWNQAGTFSVPYALVGSGTYPYDERCNIVSGIGCIPPHNGVDWIAVKITYQYTWLTPLPSLVGLSSVPPTFVQTSICRMEPVQ